MKKKLEILGHICGMTLMIALTVLMLFGSPVKGNSEATSDPSAAQLGCAPGGACPPWTCHFYFVDCDGAYCGGTCDYQCPGEPCCSFDLGYCVVPSGTCWDGVCSGSWCSFCGD